MGNQLETHGGPVGILWVCSALVVLAWDSHGTPTTWGFHEITELSHVNSMRLRRDSDS